MLHNSFKAVTNVSAIFSILISSFTRVVICFLKRIGIRNATAIRTMSVMPVIFRVFLRIFFIADG